MNWGTFFAFGFLSHVVRVIPHLVLKHTIKDCLMTEFLGCSKLFPRITAFLSPNPPIHFPGSTPNPFRCSKCIRFHLGTWSQSVAKTTTRWLINVHWIRGGRRSSVSLVWWLIAGENPETAVFQRTGVEVSGEQQFYSRGNVLQTRFPISMYYLDSATKMPLKIK